MFGCILILSSCSNASKEAETYFNEVYSDALNEHENIEKSIIDFYDLALTSELEKALLIISENIIPETEAILEALSDTNENAFYQM